MRIQPHFDKIKGAVKPMHGIKHTAGTDANHSPMKIAIVEFTKC